MPRIPFFQCSRRDVLAGAVATLGGAVFGAGRGGQKRVRQPHCNLAMER